MPRSSYKRTSPVSPTGPTRAEQKHAARQHEADVIAATRRAVFLRDKGCRCCHSDGRRIDEMHEIQSRAKLRGRPPEEIFTKQNCLRLCKACHASVTGKVGGHRVWIEVTTPAGADGPVTFATL
jgi:5-methylcytosine-specific restriction endonuclease McrA